MAGNHIGARLTLTGRCHKWNGRARARYQTPGAGRPQSSAQRGVEGLDSFTLAFEEFGGVRLSTARELGANRRR